MEKTNIIININDEYVFPAIVMLTSFHYNNKTSKSRVLVLHRGLKNASISLITNKIGNYFDLSFINTLDDLHINVFLSGHISTEAYLRIFAYKYYDPEISRAIYIDSDIIINGSLERFYNMDFEDTYLIACEDRVISKKNRKVYDSIGLPYSNRYFNSGIMVMNIEKMKKTKDIELKLVSYIEKIGNKAGYHDQDILNGFYTDNCKIIDSKNYNLLVTDITSNYQAQKRKKSSAVFHFADRWKPWKNDYIGYLSDEFWKYAVYAGFVEEYGVFLKENKKWNTYLNRCVLNYKRRIKNIISIKWSVK